MDNNLVTYSRSMSINLTNICYNQCQYCGFVMNQLDQKVTELAVPYSTIKMSQQARKQGVKEIRLVSGERPDKFAAIRVRLDQWGFSSFIEYVFTVAELVFLEGMLPSIEIGILSKPEIEILRRIAVSMVMMLDAADEDFIKKYSPNKPLAARIDTIKNAGECKFPVTTGFIVGMGESQKSHKDALEIIKDLHLEYGHVQNVVIRNFVPMANTKMAELKGPTKAEMLKVVELAQKILPKDVTITVPAVLNPDILSFIKKGVRDVGEYDLTEEPLLKYDFKKSVKTLEAGLKKQKLGLQHRLPIFAKYIMQEWYSRKTAQLLDKYKMMLKQAEERSED